ncbi:hypothetical protein [Variovorax sp. DT-64]|uniref:hypothetical protein n=1 Tax=Variovorax sp. DT-64 TaxID=3396160 RepID=UPI003F53EB7E
MLPPIVWRPVLAHDIADAVQLARGVADEPAHFGRLDHLVNLACTHVDDGAESGRLPREWLHQEHDPRAHLRRVQ